jgi:adenine-specific DNA methylase
MACILALILAACVGAPSVTRTKGGGYHATAGYTLFAEREGVVAEVITQEGDTIRYMVKKEDADNVAGTYVNYWGLGKLGKITADSETARVKSDERIKLGDQRTKVQMNQDNLNAGLTSEVIKTAPPYEGPIPLKAVGDN